ncbi:MAG: ArsR/SmtB family transcription factor [Candidatus Thorarchaeota archaeon]
MKNTKFLKPFIDDKHPPEQSFELLMDPIRSKILFEIVLKGEVTAEMLTESTGKSRSTISHHLKKLVESGIVEVYMNPVGKTKFYRIIQDIESLAYSLNKEEFKKGSNETKSAFILELANIFAIVNNIYSNLFSDQIKLLSGKQPFDDVNVESNGNIHLKIGEKEIMMPYMTFFITGEEEAKFVQEKIQGVMREFGEKFREIPDMETLRTKPKFILNLQILPYIDEKDLE